MRKWRKWLGIIVIIFIIAATTGGITLWGIGFFEEPDWSRLEDSREASIIYDEQKKILKEYCTYCREIIPLERMGGFPDFAIAAEDKDFWKRQLPVSWRGMFRAFLHNLKTHSANQGGSTISEQTAKNIFAEQELAAEAEAKKTGTGYRRMQTKIWRKMRQGWLAFRLERRLDRKKILELYLNTSYCGWSRYGVKSCSQFWFAQDPTNLTPEQSAWIIGLLRMPRVSADPTSETALALRNRVLDQFATENLLTKEESEKLKQSSMPNLQHDNRNPAPHFTEYVRRLITEKTTLVDSGLRITTTLNAEWQRVTSNALAESIAHMQERNPELTDLWGAAILIHAQSGAIKALAQYPPYRENQFLIDQIKRHCGSACKPFFYTAWLERGGRFAQQDEGTGPARLADIHGIKINMGGGESKIIQNFPYPANAMKRYVGMAEPLLCIAESRNACTMSGVAGVSHSPIPLSQRITKEEILRIMGRLRIQPGAIDPATARERGITVIDKNLAMELNWIPNTVDPGLTLAIGSVDISPFDMARAWTGFLGILVDPYAVEDIRDGTGKQVNIEPEKKNPVVIFEESIQLQMLRGLRATIEFPHGTGQTAKRELDFPVCGKTGTATNQKGDTTDNWFIGCTPSYIMAVWIGREQKLPMKTVLLNGKEFQETGGKNALPVFIKTMKAVYEVIPKEQFPEATDPTKPFRYPRASEPLPAETAEGPETPSEDKNDY